MVGMLQTDDADVAVAPLSITEIRSLSIDFTIPIQIVRYMLVTLSLSLSLCNHLMSFCCYCCCHTTVTTNSHLTSSTRLYIRRPVLEGTWTLYGQPFDMYLWLTIPVSILVCGEPACSVTMHPFSTGMHFYIYSARYSSILYSFRNSCGD